MVERSVEEVIANLQRKIKDEEKKSKKGRGMAEKKGGEWLDEWLKMEGINGWKNS